MPRILAIDYGIKRTGISVTDPLKIIATGMETLLTTNLIPFLTEYTSKEKVEEIVIGLPVDLRNRENEISQKVRKLAEDLRNKFPKIEINFFDERFTSKLAFQTMIQAGTSKKQRRNKMTIDKISATILLQDYLGKKENESHNI